MIAMEKRQATRLIRIGKGTEQMLFDLIASLQEGRLESCSPYEWDHAMRQLLLMRDDLDMMLGLCKNLQTELGEVRH